MFFCMFIYSELLIASFTFILGVFLFIIQNIFMIFVVGPSKKFIESKTRLKAPVRLQVRAYKLRSNLRIKLRIKP